LFNVVQGCKPGRFRPKIGCNGQNFARAAKWRRTYQKSKSLSRTVPVHLDRIPPPLPIRCLVYPRFRPRSSGPHPAHPIPTHHTPHTTHHAPHTTHHAPRATATRSVTAVRRRAARTHARVRLHIPPPRACSLRRSLARPRTQEVHQIVSGCRRARSAAQARHTEIRSSETMS